METQEEYLHQSINKLLPYLLYVGCLFMLLTIGWRLINYDTFALITSFFQK